MTDKNQIRTRHSIKYINSSTLHILLLLKCEETLSFASRQGTDSEDQFLLSVRLCGTQEITPDLVSRIPKYSICVDEHCVPRTVPYRIFINLPAQWAEDLFCQMMVLDPNLRLTAQEALRHPCFSMAGRDADKHELQVVVNTFVNRVYPYRMKCLCLPPKHHPLYYYPYLAGAF